MTAGRGGVRTDRRSLWLLLGIVAVPLLLGLIASLVWWQFGDARNYYVIGPLAQVPAVAGTVLSAVFALWLLGRRDAADQAHRELERSTREQTARQRRLLSRLDHELKNPIQGIRAALADERSERQLASIEAQSRRLTRLMSDLRKVGEVEHTSLELAPVDLTDLVEEAVLALQEFPGAQDRLISISLPRAPRPLPAVVADTDLLFLAMSNLLANAVKFSEPRDAIEVRGRTEDGWVILEVADTGRGISQEDLDLVWEELGRAADVRAIEGSGLGLPLVRAIVTRHGGTCSLESWHAEGSTVTVRLPVAGPHGTP